MSGFGRRFDPAELNVPGEPELTTAEAADTLAAARDLETLASDAGIRPTDDFEDRVMAAIAAEPAPRLVATPASAARGGMLGGFLATVRRSWAIASSGGRPVAVRMQALAFVLLVVLAAGALTSVTVVTVGTLMNSSGPRPSPAPTVAPFVTPSPSPGLPTSTVSPDPTIVPSDSPEPTPTAEPRETARPTRTPRPAETPEATDDHGGNSGPGSTDDHGGNSGPSSTDDHGGNSGPGSSDDDGGSGGGGEGPG
jgi:uncharacterized membrane protein YgcG